MTGEAPNHQLKVLVADGHEGLLEQVTDSVAALGHEVIQETDLSRLGPVTAKERGRTWPWSWSATGPLPPWR